MKFVKTLTALLVSGSLLSASAMGQDDLNKKIEENFSKIPKILQISGGDFIGLNDFEKVSFFLGKNNLPDSIRGEIEGEEFGMDFKYYDNKLDLIGKVKQVPFNFIFYLDGLERIDKVDFFVEGIIGEVDYSYKPDTLEMSLSLPGEEKTILQRIIYPGIDTLSAKDW